MIDSASFSPSQRDIRRVASCRRSSSRSARPSLLLLLPSSLAVYLAYPHPHQSFRPPPLLLVRCFEDHQHSFLSCPLRRSRRQSFRFSPPLSLPSFLLLLLGLFCHWWFLWVVQVVEWLRNKRSIAATRCFSLAEAMRSGILLGSFFSRWGWLQSGCSGCLGKDRR